MAFDKRNCTNRSRFIFDTGTDDFFFYLIFILSPILEKQGILAAHGLIKLSS